MARHPPALDFDWADTPPRTPRHFRPDRNQNRRRIAVPAVTGVVAAPAQRSTTKPRTLDELEQACQPAPPPMEDLKSFPGYSNISLIAHVTQTERAWVREAARQMDCSMSTAIRRLLQESLLRHGVPRPKLEE